NRCSKLQWEPIPHGVYCSDCDVNSTIENYKFACASCGQPNNNVVKGTELLIHQVQFDSEEELSVE
ncbi:MAG: hydrogenase/urease maturation nickel metallochaperone HypA, partial [Bacteroidota bacterium]